MKHSWQLTLSGAALALLTCGAAHAQNAEFTGPVLAIGVGAVHDEVDYGGFLAGKTGKDDDTAFKLDGSYGFSLSPQWVATVGATYDLNETDFGTVNYVDSGTPYTVQTKLKNHYSLYVAPGYRVSPNWLVYAKLAWHHAKGEYKDSQIGTGETHHSGVGYGLGVATVLAKQVEARFEVQYVDFNRKSANLSNGKPETTEAMAYIGYRF